jgi:hypothetical protein
MQQGQEAYDYTNMPSVKDKVGEKFFKMRAIRMTNLGSQKKGRSHIWSQLSGLCWKYFTRDRWREVKGGIGSRFRQMYCFIAPGSYIKKRQTVRCDIIRNAWLWVNDTPQLPRA